ncbi:MAG: hypothetical protein IPP90_01370 [Gemmatimonadaceae bacterium]|nr:hypothetical protein [Gemmatimonadaceae bacterium]
MKLLTKALATIALVALPTVAQAQFDVTMTITGQPIAAGIPNVDMGGGQFTATTSDPSLANLFVYCIDNLRPFQFQTAYQYRVFTFQEYVSALLPSSLATQSVDDLNEIAKNTEIIRLNGQGPRQSEPPVERRPGELLEHLQRCDSRFSGSALRQYELSRARLS